MMLVWKAGLWPGDVSTQEGTKVDHRALEVDKLDAIGTRFPIKS